MIAPNTSEETPVLVNGHRGKLLLMWTDGTADVRMDDGQTLIDVPLVQIEVQTSRLFPDAWAALDALEEAIEQRKMRGRMISDRIAEQLHEARKAVL